MTLHENIILGQYNRPNGEVLKISCFLGEILFRVYHETLQSLDTGNILRVKSILSRHRDLHIFQNVNGS